MGPKDRVIVLIDMDCFFCQVEETFNPALKGKPIAVVQYNAWGGGGIIAVNYPARELGVTRHMRAKEAREVSPLIQLTVVPSARGKADTTRYRDAGKKVADVLATYTPLLERASVDEAYMDITEAVNKRMESGCNALTVEALANTFVVGSEVCDFIENAKLNSELDDANLKLAFGALITEEIRAEVFNKTGYRCSAGVAHNKVLAKLVCALLKPNKQTVLPQEGVEELFKTMPIKKVKGLGGKFGQTLSEDFSVQFVGELLKFSERDLAKKYDEKTAHWLYNIARGHEFEPVTTKLIGKSIGCCKQFPGKNALTTAENVKIWLTKLSEELAERLEQDKAENNRRAKQVIVNFTQEVNKRDVSSSRTQSLQSYAAPKIMQNALEIINKFCQRSDGSYNNIKLMGFSASNFEEIKKVKEITSFFKNMAQNVRTPADLVKKNEEDSVYLQTTQELKENVDEMTFFDDSCRVKSEEARKSPEISQSKASSFFLNYFNSRKDTKQEENQATIQKKSKDALPSTSAVSNDDPSEICSKCQRSIKLSDVESHKDYHFALELSKSEQVRPTQTPKEAAPAKKVQAKKRKNPETENNKIMMSFIQKNQQDEELEGREKCGECGKSIKIDEMLSHLDYHAAKKLHLEINPETVRKVATPTQTITQEKKVGRKKVGKNKGNSNSPSLLQCFLSQHDK